MTGFNTAAADLELIVLTMVCLSRRDTAGHLSSPHLGFMNTVIWQKRAVCLQEMTLKPHKTRAGFLFGVLYLSMMIIRETCSRDPARWSMYYPTRRAASMLSSVIDVALVPGVAIISSRYKRLSIFKAFPMNSSLPESNVSIYSLRYRHLSA